MPKNVQTTLISHSSKVMLKILQARLQQYVNCEFPDVQAGFRKGRDQIANICWIMEKGREFQKNIYFCFIDCAKSIDRVDYNKLWKILNFSDGKESACNEGDPGLIPGLRISLEKGMPIHSSILA